MEPAVIVTTAILLTLVVGLVVQTAVSYVKKAKKTKKPAKDKRKRPESNKENVVPSPTSFGAPSSAISFEASSGGQTKITEQSHYQQIKSSVIRSESPVAPPTVLKHETTKTETRTSGDKLLPLCVEAFHDSVLSPISGIIKTKQQEVTEHTNYQQFQSSTVNPDQSQTQFSPLRSETPETQTKLAAEKLLPVCVEAFQDSVLSPISGIKNTKKQEVTEHSNYQQFQSSTVCSDQSQPQFSPLSSETQTKSAAEKLLPVCVEAFQDSVLSPISGIKKTKTQEVTEHTNYQQFQSSTVNSDQLQTQFSPLRSEAAETQTKSAAEKLLPVCVEAFQDSVLSPISGIKKTKKQEVIENSHYQDNISNINHSVTPPLSPDSSRIWMSVTETKSSAAEKILPMCVEAFQDSVLSPISGISKTKHQEVVEHSHQQQNKFSSIRPVSPAVYRSSPKPWSPTTQTPVIKKVLPLCVEAFQDSIQSPISGISKTKRQEVLEQSSASSVSSLVRCVSPKPWMAPDTETKISATETGQPLDMSQSSVIRSVTPPVRSSASNRQTFGFQETSAAEKLLPLCVEAFQDSVLSPISGHKSTKNQEVIEHSYFKQTHQSNEVLPVVPAVPSDESRIWMCVSEVRSSPAEKLLPLCVEAFQDSVLSPISGIKKTKKQEVTEQSQFEQNIARVKQFWHERTSTADVQSRAKNLLPICVEAFQDSVLSPISGIKSKKSQKVTETSYRQQSHSSMSRSVASPMFQSAPKPSMPQTQVKSSTQKLLPMCVEAFQDSVLSPISGIKKTKTQEIQSNVVRSVTPPVSTVSPKPWKYETNAKPSTAEKLLPVCVEAFQDCVLSPISVISKTKKQEIQSGAIRSPTPPVPNTVPKPWKSELQPGSSAAAKLLPMCMEAFQDSVLSPISGIPKTKQQEISSSPIRSVTPPVLSTTPKPWKPETQATSSSAEKLLPLCVEAFHDSVLSPISGISKTKKQEPTMPVASTAQEPHSAGEKLLPLCVEAFQDSVLSPISSISKTKKNEVIEPAAAELPAQPSGGEKLLPLCVEAFQDSVLSPISGIRKTKNQEMTEPSAEPSAGEKLLPLCVEAFQDSVLSPISGISKTKDEEVAAPSGTEVQAQPPVGEKLLPLCVEAFQDSVLSPISGIAKTKNKEVVETEATAQASAGEKLLPLCVEAFQDSVLSPISGIKKTKSQEVTETEVAETHPKVSPGEALLPLCVEAFQDSVLSPISGISKTKTEQDAAATPNVNEAGERLLPLCVEAFQDCVLSPISGISKTKNTEVTDHAQETKSTAIYSETLPSSQKPEMTDAQKLIPVCVEAFRDSVLSPISGISKTKTQEVTQDGRKTEKTTTETIQETKGSCQTTILRKEKESVVHDSFVTGNRPIYQATPISAVMSQPSTVKTTKFESKTSETKQNVWQPTGAVAGKIKEYSSNQPKFSTTSIRKSITTSSNVKQRPLSCPDVSAFDFQKMGKEMALAGTVNKPVAPVSESVVSHNVYQQSEMQSSTIPRRIEYDSGTSFGAVTSPEPPLMPSRPFPAAPVSKPTFQNFNTTPKTWNEVKKTDISQPSGFKPVRPPTYYAK